MVFAETAGARMAQIPPSRSEILFFQQANTYVTILQWRKKSETTPFLPSLT